MSGAFGPVIAGIMTFGLTVAAMLALRPLAYVVDLLDRPGGHKTHHGAVPVVGGLAMFLGLVFSLGAIPSGVGSLQFFLVSAAALVVVGMLDDRFSLSPWLRLAVQLVAVLPMFYGANVRVEDLGMVFGESALPVGQWSLVMTAIVTVAAINALNMLDGLDGLAGAVSLVALAALYVASSASGNAGDAYIVGALCGAVVGFLVFNLPIRANRPVRCFMGDAGSTLLGFAIAWFSIKASQADPVHLPAGAVLWILAIPAYDLQWTIVRRILRGQSPFRADNEHLHHSLLRAGLGVRAVFVVMLATAIVLACVGLVGFRMGVNPSLMLVAWAACGGVVVASFRNAGFVVRLIPERFRRLPSDQPVPGIPNPVPHEIRRER